MVSAHIAHTRCGEGHGGRPDSRYSAQGLQANHAYSLLAMRVVEYAGRSGAPCAAAQPVGARVLERRLGGQVRAVDAAPERRVTGTSRALYGAQ